jgi:hypothetical protein
LGVINNKLCLVGHHGQTREINHEWLVDEFIRIHFGSESQSEDKTFNEYLKWRKKGNPTEQVAKNKKENGNE